MITSVGPESLEDYFQKGALLDQKAALNLWYVDTRPKISKSVPEHLKVCHIWLIKKNLMFSYISFSHNSIVFLSMNIYQCIAGKKR